MSTLHTDAPELKNTSRFGPKIGLSAAGTGHPTNLRLMNSQPAPELEHIPRYHAMHSEQD